MARISKNGNLIGGVGNFIFVRNDDKQYVRSKPAKVKQSAKTKAAASVFGWMSTKDKLYRQVLLDQFPIVTDSRYAARHRAKMAKTLVTPDAADPSANPAVFQNPEALLGFEFNNDLLWTKATQFFPEFSNIVADEVLCKIPALKWGKQIKPPKNCNKALVTFEAFHVDPNAETMEILPLSTWSAELSYGQSQDATAWNFDVSNLGSWLLILGSVKFNGDASLLSLNQKNAATYLWATDAARMR